MKKEVPSMLASDAQAVLDAMAAARAPAIETLPPAEAKRMFLENAPRLQGEKEAVAETHDLRAPGPAGEIPLRLYRGFGCAAAEAPALLYFHGGGWVVGSIETHDNICRWIANFAAAVVISVDYRLAPEHPFPAAIDDAAAALRHITEHAGDFGIDRQRVAVGGDSAGGNIAAVVALLARDGEVPSVAFQMLLYPVTDVSTTQDSYQRYAEDYGLTTAAMRWFGRHYLGAAGDGADWRVSPLRAPSLGGLPPAFIVTAGYDVLHDEARDYAARLAEADVPVGLDANPGQIHGFISMDGFIGEARRCIGRAVEAWRASETRIGGE
jgi:acetyl esterase